MTAILGSLGQPGGNVDIIVQDGSRWLADLVAVSNPGGRGGAGGAPGAGGRASSTPRQPGSTCNARAGRPGKPGRPGPRRAGWIVAARDVGHLSAAVVGFSDLE